MAKITDEFKNFYVMQVIYLHHIYNALKYCTSYYNEGSYRMAFQALYNDFHFPELLNGEWGKKFISKATIKKLKIFHNAWKNYVKVTPYSDSIFVFFDETYRNIVNEYLVPALDSFENDFKTNNIYEISYEDTHLKLLSYSETFDLNKRPPDLAILNSLDNLYTLLLERKILQKPYMGSNDL